MADDERRRLSEPSGATSEWYQWGPYLSERQWGTVREDYSADGSAWTYLPHGLWDEADGLFYDRLVTPSGAAVPVKAQSMVGIIPVLAAAVVDEQALDHAVAVGKQFAGLLDRHLPNDPEPLAAAGLLRGDPGDRRLLVGAVGVDRVTRLFRRLFDPDEFLSPYGLRSLSAYHRDHPYTIDVDGVRATIDYEPAESTTAMFGGNSNWRGPVWFPLNYLATSALQRYGKFFGDDFQVEYPTGSGDLVTLGTVVADLWARLASIFVVGPDRRRPCFGWVERLQNDPNWQDNLLGWTDG